MADREQFTQWVEFGLQQPNIEDTDWIRTGYETFKKPSRHIEGGISCGIFELALIGKCGSLEQAKALYEMHKGTAIPVQDSYFLSWRDSRGAPSSCLNLPTFLNNTMPI